MLYCGEFRSMFSLKSAPETEVKVPSISVMPRVLKMNVICIITVVFLHQKNYKVKRILLDISLFSYPVYVLNSFIP